MDTRVLFYSTLNVASDLIDKSTSSLKSTDSFLSSPAILVRPFEEALQIVADIVDRVQVKRTIGANDRLFSVF